MKTILETDRLFLREFSDGDYDDLCEILQVYTEKCPKKFILCFYFSKMPENIHFLFFGYDIL
jgi:hypothetical protein